MLGSENVWEFAYLKTADKCIGNVILEELSSLVVLATPAPDVLAVICSLALVQDTSTNTPHDDAENEESDCERGVVNCNLLGPSVASPPVGVEDENGHEKRNRSDTDESYLRPYRSAGRPRREIVSGRKMLGCVEDGESG